MEKISVIIPVLNESNLLPVTLPMLNISENEELIIVDGGSTDLTPEIARRFTGKLITAERGRGKQMKRGAETAKGDILFFLHADCIVPENTFENIRSLLKDANISAGAFNLGIHSRKKRYRIIEFAVFLRNRITSLPYGDQGLFLKKEIYEKIGGYSDLPLMEDVDIVRRLKKAGRIAFINKKILASPRRWEKEGIVYTTVRDWILALLYTLFKVSPERLIKFYKIVR